jgi:TrmH family RNA methyltransferase
MSELKKAYSELTIAGTSAHGEKTVFSTISTNPAMIMIGNETEGLSFNLQNKCDLMLTIPMASNSSATSLNVACAASIVFYEIARQRAGGGMEGLL